MYKYVHNKNKYEMKYGKKWQAFFEIFQVEWEPCNISDKTRVQELV